MISLRGHHLLCTVTYAGQGYSRKFERGFMQVVERLKKNETILVVSGPDEICASIESCSDSHCREARISQRDELALEDISLHLGETLNVGSQISPSRLFDEEFRISFQQRSIRRACIDCQWSNMCDQIAESNYSSSLLFR